MNMQKIKSFLVSGELNESISAKRDIVNTCGGHPQNTLIKNLSMLKEELDKAAKIQPCPGCKHDIEQLSKFINTQITGHDTNYSKEDMKTLKEVDYINELTNLGITLSKFIDPLARNLHIKVPDIYEKVLKEDLEANKQVKVYLTNAKNINEELNRTKNYKLISEILTSFIRATDFKLSIDPFTFYIFDKTIRFGYKTHLLSATGKAIVSIKGIIDPSRYS